MSESLEVENHSYTSYRRIMMGCGTSSCKYEIRSSKCWNIAVDGATEAAGLIARNSLLIQLLISVLTSSCEMTDISSHSSSSDIEYLERELRKELEEFDHLLADDTSTASLAFLNPFELAEAEGEREALQDRLHLLLARSDDMEHEMNVVKGKLLAMTVVSETLKLENDNLRKIGSNLTGIASDGTNSSSSSSRYNDLEYKFAVTRSNLARAQQVAEDQVLAREVIERELHHEQRRREHAEKERDAYSSAYEASLKHFERWSEKKQQQTKLSPFHRTFSQDS